MTYALCVGTSERGIYEVQCACCLKGFGTMKGETIRTAIVSRGPLLCPDCRRKKCDYCGQVLPVAVARVKTTGDGICVECVCRGVNPLEPECRFTFKILKPLPIKGSVLAVSSEKGL